MRICIYPLREPLTSAFEVSQPGEGIYLDQLRKKLAIDELLNMSPSVNTSCCRRLSWHRVCALGGNLECTNTFTTSGTARHLLKRHIPHFDPQRKRFVQLNFNMASHKRPRLPPTQLAAIMNDYYTFLTTFYMPSSALKHPPPGGWPNISADATKSLDKSPVVIEVMKHLPYIDEAEAGEMITNIHYKSDVVDYSTYTAEDFERYDVSYGEDGLKVCIKEMEERRREEEEAEEEEEENNGTNEEEENSTNEAEDDSENEDTNSDDEHAPNDEGYSSDEEEDYGDDPDDVDIKDILLLSMGYESGGRILLLDVHKGIIHEDIVRCQLVSGVWIEDFFDDMKDKLRRLDCVPVRGEFYEGVPEVEHDGPVPETADESLDEHDEEHVKVCKRIYRKFGWPGEGYRKDEAMEAVEKYRVSAWGY